MNFQEYLDSNGKAKRTADTYSSVIRGIEKNEGKKINLSNVGRIINEYSQGGAKFDSKDHANKTNALKWYREYLNFLSSGKYAILTPQVYRDAGRIEAEYCFTDENGYKKHFPIEDLLLSLHERIIAVDGIREQARDMTGKDSNPEYVRFLLGRRKNTTSYWFDDLLCPFVNSANFRANNHFGELISMIQHGISEEIKKKYPDENACKNLISILLYSIIGYFTVTAPDSDSCEKAKTMLDELKNAVVIIRLLGEYEDHLLDGNDYPFEEYENLNELKHSVIHLYLDNIAADSADVKSFVDRLYSTLAHEYFHFHHYFSIWEKYGIIRGGRLNSKYKEEMNAYCPGKVVKESLAAYFEREYMIRHGHDRVKIDNMKEVWDRRDWRSWPYSGAKYISDNSHFREIFLVSLDSFSRALGTLGL